MAAATPIIGSPMCACVRNRRRTVLTLASTAVSLALLSLLTALYQGFFYSAPATPSEARRLICRHRVSLTQPLPASHFQRIRSVPGVEQVSAWTWFQGKYKEPKDFFARFAVDVLGSRWHGGKSVWIAPEDPGGPLTPFPEGYDHLRAIPIHRCET